MSRMKPNLLAQPALVSILLPNGIWTPTVIAVRGEARREKMRRGGEEETSRGSAGEAERGLAGE